MSIFFQGPDWATSRPVAVSDTVDNLRTAEGMAVRAIGNRSGSSALVAILYQNGTTNALRVGSASALMWGSAWKRLLATGTSGSGSSGAAYETIHTTAAGLAFTNQPANDGIEVVSSAAGDTTQTLTLYGTTNGVDTVVAETITLNGTSQVSTVKVDWGLLLGAELSAATAGTVTIREASGNATITTLTAGVLSRGVESVAAATQSAYNTPPTIVASGATTKQLGLIGTNQAGATIFDSQALNGTTAVAANSGFYTVTKVLTGDLEATRTATVSVSADFVVFL